MFDLVEKNSFLHKALAREPEQLMPRAITESMDDHRTLAEMAERWSSWSGAAAATWPPPHSILRAALLAACTISASSPTSSAPACMSTRPAQIVVCTARPFAA